MNMLIVALTVIPVVVLGVVIYRYFKDGGTVAALSVEGLVAEANNIVGQLEDYASTETDKVADLVVQKTGLENTIATVNLDIQRAKDFADKIKAVL